MSELLTPGELAARFKLSKAWIYMQTRRASKSGLPYIRVGKSLRFDWIAVEKWLDERRRA